MNDHQDKMLELAGHIANDIINGVPVRYGNGTPGNNDYDEFTMLDVFEDIYCRDEPSKVLEQLNINMALSLNCEVELHKWKKEYEDFIFEQVGSFAESVSWRVYNYQKEEAADDMAANLLNNI